MDYKEDYENNSNSNLEQDSFNKDIIKLYEDHKKSIGKPTEMQNLNRPISSYHRQSGKREEVDCKSSENLEVSIENLISRINSHIVKLNFKKSDILDNSGVYLDIDDFKEFFKHMKFDINQSELSCLFRHKNNSYEEGYIYGKTIVDVLSLNDLLPSDKTLEEEKISTKSFKKNEYDLKDINNQLKVIQNEVNEIDFKENNSNKNNKHLLSINNNYNHHTNNNNNNSNAYKNPSYNNNCNVNTFGNNNARRQSTAKNKNAFKDTLTYRPESGIKIPPLNCI